MIQVFIVDDHKMVIEGIVLLLKNHESIQVMDSALSGEEALDKLSQITPQVVLLDINMPGMNGIDTCKKMIELQPNIKIIALSMHKESSLIKLMLSSGAKGYVLKNAGQDEIIEAIETVYQGKTYLDDIVNEIIVNSVAKSKKQKPK